MLGTVTPVSQVTVDSNNRVTDAGPLARIFDTFSTILCVARGMEGMLLVAWFEWMCDLKYVICVYFKCVCICMHICVRVYIHEYQWHVSYIHA